MDYEHPNAVAKIHPATREVLPDDPLSLHGVELPGDTDLMLRLLVEEYARLGFGLDRLMDLARDPFYQSFYGLRSVYGEQELRRRMANVLDRVGVSRIKIVEQQVEPLPGQLVEIDLPPSSVTSSAKEK